MLKINLFTGIMWTKSITVDANKGDDLIQALDDFVQKQGIESLPVATYTVDELDPCELETYVPINGGECYIEGIASVQEV